MLGKLPVLESMELWWLKWELELKAGETKKLKLIYNTYSLGR
jgi:hypothetical protein